MIEDDDQDLRAVAEAYRAERLKSDWDHPAHEAAVAALQQRHPDMTRDQAAKTAARLIYEASLRYGSWLYGRD